MTDSVKDADAARNIERLLRLQHSTVKIIGTVIVGKTGSIELAQL
jgi:hypothetical protein